MFSLKKGRALAKISGGKYNGEILYLNTEDNTCCKCCKKCSDYCKNKPCCKKCNLDQNFGDTFIINDGKFLPIPKLEDRGVDYIAGPSGSGKSTYAANLALAYKMVNPKNDFFIFSRGAAKTDPAFSKLNPIQIPINESIVDHPIDITKELTKGCLILFDDCNTIQDDKQKKAIDKLMADIMEIGRKLDINIIITNHLVIPNEKKIARTIMNEMQSLTVFPKSGSTHQIKYCLKQYYGLNNKQITDILEIPSRWITIIKNYPMCILFDKGALLL